MDSKTAAKSSCLTFGGRSLKAETRMAAQPANLDCLKKKTICEEEYLKYDIQIDNNIERKSVGKNRIIIAR